MAKTPWMISVERAVRSIPKGQTASYGQVAMLAGRAGAARAVVRALHALDGLPWWRVIRSDGTIAEPVRAEQTRRLKAEGVAVKAGRVPASARALRRERAGERTG